MCKPIIKVRMCKAVFFCKNVNNIPLKTQNNYNDESSVCVNL